MGVEEDAPPVAAAGHVLITPTYTGVGERVHLATPTVGLDDPHPGHRGGARDRGPARRGPDRAQLRRHGGDRRRRPGARPHRAARLPRRLRPQDGQSSFDLSRPRCGACARWHEAPATAGACRPTRCRPTRPRRRRLGEGRRVPQPIQSFEQPVRLSAPLSLPRSYIYCTRAAPGDVFRQFADRRSQPAGAISSSMPATTHTSPCRKR